VSAGYQGPRRLADIRQAFADGRTALHHAPELAMPTPVAPPLPPPGSAEALELEIRTRGEGRDLRAQPRIAVDEIWRRAQEDVLAKFGRRLPVDAWDCESDASAIALRAAQAAEANFLGIACGPAPLRAAVEDTRREFFDRVASYLNAATAGWPPAAQYAAQQRRELEDWR
jgi:hypothetical protein